MKINRNFSTFLYVANLLLLTFLVTSFVNPDKNAKKNHVPFVLHLSQGGSEKVTAILDSTKSVRMKSGFVTLQQGDNVGSHNTWDHEELLVILGGEGEVEAQGLGKQKLTEGMVVYIPPNNQHNVYCSGSSPLRYIYIVAPVK
jgi:quercetin dioxygenase-like cupin family protein